MCLVFVGGLLLAGCRRAPGGPAWDPASGAPLPTRVAWDVPGRAQGHSLSCEARSACDLLAWHGIRVDEDAFLAELARSDNPEEGFVGSVDDPGGGLPPAGYGVYERPLADRLRAHGLEAIAVRGRDLPWLCHELAQGRCVVVWATSGLDAPAVRAWTDRLGRRVEVVPGEHTYLAVGYEPGRILLLDPATGSRRSVPAERFSRSWSVLGNRAVTSRSAPVRWPRN